MLVFAGLRRAVVCVDVGIDTVLETLRSNVAAGFSWAAAS